MGKHARGILYLEPGAKPRHRFVIAISTIVLLLFGAMVVVAVLYPDEGPLASTEDPYRDPFGQQAGGDIGGSSVVAPTGPLMATYAVPSNAVWDNAFQAQVALTNASPVAQPWQIVLRYPANVTGMSGTWVDGQPQPIVEMEPEVFRFTGAAPVQPGQTVLFKVQFDREPGTDLALGQCTANGRPCTSG